MSSWNNRRNGMDEDINFNCSSKKKKKKLFEIKWLGEGKHYSDKLIFLNWIATISIQIG